ncbi:MAG: RNA methyltransferase [Dehalococcoidales bacterium]|nr:MAG: RNA methyltransferase [Dehalococcoidales bacterium]
MPQKSNPQKPPLKPLKWYRKLAARKGRLEADAFIVEGERAVRQVVESLPEEVLEIVTVEGIATPYPHYPLRTVTESQFRSISQAQTPQGLLAVVRPPWQTYTDSVPIDPGTRLLLLDDIQDPGNVGTLIRTAAAFGFSGVILTDKSADPFSPKCVQASAGSILSVWLRRTDEYLRMVQALKKRGYFVLAADLNGKEDTSVFDKRRLLLLALGNEAAGLSEEMLAASDYQLRVPIVRDKAESLNVATCGAILMYLVTRK